MSINSISGYVIPVFIITVIIAALFKRVDVWSAFLNGVKKGLDCAIGILPSLFALVIAIEMVSQSGALAALSRAVSPFSRHIGIPGEILPLTLMRSVSGSGATAVFQNILKTYGADTYIGRCASVIMGSTETTFYTLAVYFGAVRAKGVRYCLFCALLADFTGSLAACFVCRFL